MTDMEMHDADTGEVYEPQTTDLTVVSAEINMQVATAKRFPRPKDVIIAKEIMSRATLNEDVATECVYKLKRGGADIEGASIRFAEIVRSCYRNVRVAARFVRIDRDDPLRQAVIVEAVAMDMQNNDAEIVQVRRSIMTSPKGGPPRPYNADMTAITVQAAQSIVRRNAILALVPKALWVGGYDEANRVIRGDAKTLTARRAKLIEAFASFGVDARSLFQALGVETEHEIGLNDMPGLAGMYTALKQGETADAVLGRVREEREPPKARTSPLRDEPMSRNGASNEGEKINAAAASQVGEKIDMPKNGAGKAADVPKPEQAVEQRQAQENAQAATADKPQPSQPEQQAAAAPEKKQFIQGGAGPATYLQDGLATIANATSPTALREWWKRERAKREDLGLLPAQHDQLLDAFKGKMTALGA
jgi:hypothetical protein